MRHPARRRPRGRGSARARRECRGDAPGCRGDTEPTADALARTYGDETQPRMGFFTDTSVCIGCKACEVACKEWNQVPEDGLDDRRLATTTRAGSAPNTWRHVAFVEQRPLR